MVKPEDVQVSLPEMDELTPTQEESIDRLLQAISDAYDGEMPYIFAREESDEVRRDLAYKFLKARKWKHKDALEMVTSTVAFRKEYKIDEWVLFPCAFPHIGVETEDILTMMEGIPNALRETREPGEWDAVYRALQRSYVNLYHHTDKEGHPVLYDRFGRADVGDILKGLERITPVGKGLKDVIVPYHTYMNEIQYYLIRHANAVSLAAGRRKIMGVTVVLDAEGLHLGMIQRRFISVISSIFEVDQKYYPEVLHRLFVVNCPAIFNTAYNLIKGSLDINTRRKITLCGKAESLAILQRVIDDDKIPQELGGTCPCEGGCLRPYVPSTADGSNSYMDLVSETVTIAAGKMLRKTVHVSAGQRVGWEFSLDHHAEIHFAVYFEERAFESDSSEPFSSPHHHAPPARSLSSVESSSAASESHAPNEPLTPAVTEEFSVRKKSSVQQTKDAAMKTVKKVKLSMDSGTYEPLGCGVVHFVWDNSSSWVHSKKIQLRVL